MNYACEGQNSIYTVIYLIDWCYGSEVQFLLLRSHFIASHSLTISNLYISKKVQGLFFFLSPFPPLGRQVAYLSALQ